MCEAIIIILALGGLEYLLWRIDATRQDKQVSNLEAIKKELRALNKKKDIELKELK
jgi:type II secretory pathway pseudopilin PulG